MLSPNMSLTCNPPFFSLVTTTITTCSCHKCRFGRLHGSSSTATMANLSALINGHCQPQPLSNLILMNRITTVAIVVATIEVKSSPYSDQKPLPAPTSAYHAGPMVDDSPSPFLYVPGEDVPQYTRANSADARHDGYDLINKQRYRWQGHKILGTTEVTPRQHLDGNDFGQFISISFAGTTTIFRIVLERFSVCASTDIRVSATLITQQPQIRSTNHAYLGLQQIHSYPHIYRQG